jgi:hypothetical protein
MDRSFLAARRVLVRAAAEHEPDDQDPVAKNHQEDGPLPDPSERPLMFAVERQGNSARQPPDPHVGDDWAHIEF